MAFAIVWPLLFAGGISRTTVGKQDQRPASCRNKGTIKMQQTEACAAYIFFFFHFVAKMKNEENAKRNGKGKT